MKKILRGIFPLCLGLLVSGAAAADGITLRLSHWLPPQHPIAAEGLRSWTESITEESGGSITFQTFPSAQLGKAEDHYDMARDGIVDVAWLNPGFNAGRFPAFAAVQIPLTVSDGMGGIPAINEWYKPLAEKEMSDVHFCLAHMMSPLIFHMKNKPVLRPTDLAGLKLRPSAAMEASYMRSFGASTVPGSNPETREMLSRGIIDGTTGTMASAFVFGTDQVTDYHLGVPFAAVSFALVMNKAKYDAMTPEQKAVMDNHCSAEAAFKHFSPIQVFEDGGKAQLQALAGHTFAEPNAEILAEWKAGAIPVQEEWAKEAQAKGYDSRAVLTSLHEALKRHDALLE